MFQTQGFQCRFGKPNLDIFGSVVEKKHLQSSVRSSSVHRQCVVTFNRNVYFRRRPLALDRPVSLPVSTRFDACFVFRYISSTIRGRKAELQSGRCRSPQRSRTIVEGT